MDPSPKFQFQAVGVFVEVSENLTVNGIVPEVGVALKFATGAGTITVMKLVLVDELKPPALVAFRETEKVPAFAYV